VLIRLALTRCPASRLDLMGLAMIFKLGAMPYDDSVRKVLQIGLSANS